MEVGQSNKECPYCGVKSPCGLIKLQNFEINACSDCHAVWEIYEGKNVRLYGIKPENREIYQDLLICPICSSLLKADYENHLVVCSDPVCSYRRRIPGLSQKEKKLKGNFQWLRNFIFSAIERDEPVSALKWEEYNNLKQKVKEMEKYTLEGE